MAIVPYQLLEEMNRWKAQQQQQRPQLPPNPQITQTSDLLKDMKEVLRQENISESEKAQLYGQTLHKFQTAHKKALRPAGNKEEVVHRPTTEGEADHRPHTLRDRIVESVPVTMRRKAKLLLSMLEEHPHMSWNEQGHLEVHGKPIPGSNMIDLVNDVLRHRKGSSPRGWEEFSKGLRDMNVPQEYIGNKQRWSWMQRHDDLSDDSYVEDEDGDKFFEASYTLPPTPSSSKRSIKQDPTPSGSHTSLWEAY